MTFDEKDKIVNNEENDANTREQISSPEESHDGQKEINMKHTSPAQSIKRERGRSRKLSLSSFELSIMFQNFSSNISFSIVFFNYVKSRKKKINDLLKKDCFEFVEKSKVPKDIKIFNSRFVDEIKNMKTIETYEKSKLVVQAYNDQGKKMILIQASTIQRVNQHFILALAACTQHGLYFRNISQAYVQLITKLAKEFYI